MVYLIGFMGSGKSTVGSLAAKMGGVPFLDTDRIIEKEQEKTVADIFQEKGEAHFRELETQVLKQLSEKKKGIVSCGGGIVLKEENIRIMKESGFLICLKAAPATILERVRYSTGRPKLNGHMNLEYISAMMDERQPFYDRAKAIVLETDTKSVRELAKEILKFL
ncbi:MAG: shikimate kinase [Eubacterium sp.]|nr:shikimate kinase [Eubacterium sp.]